MNSWRFYLEFIPASNSYKFEFIVPKNEINELFITGEWLHWKQWIQFTKNITDDIFYDRFNLQLDNMIPNTQYKYIYKNNNGTHWFHYLRNGKPFNIDFQNNRFNQKNVNLPYLRTSKEEYKISIIKDNPENDMNWTDYDSPIDEISIIGDDYEIKEIDIDVDKLNYIENDMDWMDFDYPINAALSNEGEWNINCTLGKEYLREIIILDDLLNYEEFEKIYYKQAAANDENNWIFFVKCKNGLYVYFNAGCDYTGFGCQGGGTIFYDDNLEHMWKYGLDNNMRDLLQ